MDTMISNQQDALVFCGLCSITTWVLKCGLHRHILEMLKDNWEWKNLGIDIWSSSGDALRYFVTAVGQLERDVAHLDDVGQFGWKLF